MAGRGDLERLASLLPDRAAGLSAASRGVADWAKLYERAVRHRMHLIVFDAVLERGVAMPGAVEERFGRDLGRQLIWDAWIRKETSRVLEALENAGVRACPLKGPVFAERVMAKPELRPTTDVDVLVAPADVPATGEALAGLGYAREPEPACGPHPFEVRFDDGAGQVVEVHFAAHEAFGGAMRAEELLGRAEPYETREGARCVVLCAEDEALYIAAHAAGHGFDRLSMLYDLELALGRVSEAGRARMARVADSCGYGTALATSLEVLGARLGSGPAGTTTTARSAFVIAVTAALERAPHVRGLTGAVQATTLAAMHESAGAGCRYYARRVRRRLRRRGREPAKPATDRSLG